MIASYIRSQEVCPQCSTEIKSFQLNFDEAVFLCPNEKCTWPLGYTDPTIVSKRIGIASGRIQEVCPLCSCEIMAFQLNFDEAVFMCSGKECTWPHGYTEPTIIGRQFKKEHSINCDELAFDKYIKNELDGLPEFKPYTPPETSASLFDIMSIPNEDIIFLPDKEEMPSSASKSFNVTVDSTISNNVKSKPKIVDIQIISDKPKLIKTRKITLGPSVIRQVKVEQTNTSKCYNRRRDTGHPYKKFNLSDLSKTNDTNVNNNHKLNVSELKSAKIKMEDCLDELTVIAGNPNLTLSNITADPSKTKKINLNSSLTFTNKFKEPEVDLTNNNGDFNCNFEEVFNVSPNNFNDIIELISEHSDIVQIKE